MQSIALVPLFQPAGSARRGRPAGARARVVQDARSLGVHHFAFVRSSLLGLDLRDAFNRYLVWSETTTDLRYVQGRRDALLHQIIEVGRQHDATLPAHTKITHLLDLLRSDATAKPAVQLPSLDEWVEAEGMDPDMWSEADLLAEYKAAFGLDNADAQEAAVGLKDPVAERVRALNYLETILSVVPTAVDRLEAWFAKPVAKCLRNVGLLTLGDLVRFINVYGYRWHGRIKGFGAVRARQVLHWLVLEQDHLNLLVSSNAYEPQSKRELRSGASMLVQVPMVVSPAAGSRGLVQFGLGTTVGNSLIHMQASPSLAGEHGDFRSHMANTLGARNDLEAVDLWLGRYKEKPSTQRSYRKEAERFLLWCAQDLKKPLSSVTAPDVQKYRTFLQAVPATWINRSPCKRTDPAWRAFRSQPGPASQKQALVILQTLYGGLVDAGYLVANPFRSVMKSFDLPATRMDIKRSFTEAEWGHVLARLDALPTGSESLRMKCILELLVTSGIRLDELARASHKDLRLEQLPDLDETWILTVTGKRNKTREVPLNPDVVRLMGRHGGEFIQNDLQSVDQDQLPLIRTLHASVRKWKLAEDGVAMVAAAGTEGAGTRLSAAGIYAVIKRFFRHAAASAQAAGLDPLRFQKASTHWMRHTFVRQALVDGVPIEVASELAGHASIDTTSIYSTQELARKIRAVQGMKKRVAA